MARIYRNTEKFQLSVGVGYTIPSGSTVKLLVKKPDEVITYWDGTASGSNILYDTVSGDINIAGFYYVQSHIEEPAGFKGSGSVFVLTVDRFFNGN